MDRPADLLNSGHLERALRARYFAITAELTPPLSADPEALLAPARPLKGLVDAVNVTDGAGARAHMAALAAAALLVGAGIEPVLQINTRDRNRIALQGLLLGASALGVPNVLCLSGDPPSVGDQPEAKGVFDLKSGELMATAVAMRDQSRLPSGRAIGSPPRLLIGGADMPLDPAPDWEPKALRDKLAAGIDFVQTQFCFDAALLGRYIARLGDLGITERLFILVGLGPLASARQARWMRDNLPGTHVPDAILARLEGARDQASEGRRVCAELMAEYRQIPGVAGVHLMAPRNVEAIPQTIRDSGVLGTKVTR
ncbi:MAG: methylenetetrahydrofolate reductase [Alphaproteobacteria bacterium]|nr:methylenetetrahydrofolate reductase [Alphaproteobacteria bacterium]